MEQFSFLHPSVICKPQGTSRFNLLRLQICVHPPLCLSACRTCGSSHSVLGFEMMEKLRFFLTRRLFALKHQGDFKLCWAAQVVECFDLNSFHINFQGKGQHQWGYGNNDYYPHLLSAKQSKFSHAHTNGLFICGFCVQLVSPPLPSSLLSALFGCIPQHIQVYN